jgi:F-type H+-transporting ATPase subunit delta
VEEIAQVYARSLFEVALEHGELDVVKQQLGQFADVLAGDRQMQVFCFSPYFTSEEKKQGLDRAVIDPDPQFRNFLDALAERHRLPVIFRIRTEFDRLYDKENRRLPVEVTSAVALDPQTIEAIGARIGEQTGNQIELNAHVDPNILGGIVLRVGNFILDASIRNRLEQLRKQVQTAA